MKIKIISLLICLLLLTACSSGKQSTGTQSTGAQVTGTQSLDDSSEKDKIVREETNESLSISVKNATKNPKDIQSVSWPKIQIKAGNSDVKASAAAKVFKDLSREQVDYFINYLDNCQIPDFLAGKVMGRLSMEDYAGHVYLGSVSYTYKDTNGISCKIVDIFDEYPEGYDAFIAAFNDLCGENYIILGEQLEMSADYFRNATLFTDDMVNGGSIEDFLEICPTDIYQLFNTYNKAEAESVMKYFPGYKMLPREIRKADSSKEELEEYVSGLAGLFGVDSTKITDLHNGGLRLSTLTSDFYAITIYRTCDYPHENMLEEFEYAGGSFLSLVDRNGPEGMVSANNVFYSADGKFIIETGWLNGKKTMEFCEKIYKIEG